MATMSDIARRAGVALSTVSYTLSGKRPISEEARQKVYQAMEELGYQPNFLARALVTKRTKIIALLYPSYTLSSGQQEFVTSIAEMATTHGYALLLWTSPSENLEVMNMTHQGFIDGVILMEVALHDARVDLLREQNLPFTLIGRCENNEGLSFVDLDFDNAVETTIDYLRASGHTHIGLINQSEAMLKREVGYVVRARTAFYRAIQHHGLSGVDSCCDESEQAGYETVMRLFEQDPELSAFVLLTPWPSGGVLRAISDKGLRVPEDTSLVAIFSPRMAEMTTPALSSIEFPFNEMGRLGAQMLIQKLEGKEEEKAAQILLKPPLTVRRSSGPRA
ncbi:LacI family DNA-binding transcriptional regulator [Dictyobacter arantiisoli]|uniref:LacI family transcriptional regulator n=1 Tax=Dictyobacter arantiisoli TaxID=2014874 RepID=A0A5A5TBQ9_9CHLR|nr:LacI family DNA-binding transcriptional regulator [Dictyobacter arantiisoli]GCF08921.1 LacI family transcriptional regulator [Dictyobacter arantiisoli]